MPFGDDAEVAVASGSIHADHLNTPRLIADAAGTPVWKWDQQEPFGNNPADQNPSGIGIFDLPLRLPGQVYDAETGLHFNYNRDFDPSLGIYKQSDPIGLKGGLNTYAYVKSNPLLFLDPLGLFSESVHEEMTRNVARRKCPKLAGSLPAAVSAVDSLDGSQDPPFSYMHSMCEPGMSPSQGMTITEQYIDRQISRCNVPGLAKAMHAAQDKHSPSHRGCQPWPGRNAMTARQLGAHGAADLGPEGVHDATIESELVINRFKQRCPCMCE